MEQREEIIKKYLSNQLSLITKEDRHDLFYNDDKEYYYITDSKFLSVLKINEDTFQFIIYEVVYNYITKLKMAYTEDIFIEKLQSKQSIAIEQRAEESRKVFALDKDSVRWADQAYEKGYIAGATEERDRDKWISLEDSQIPENIIEVRIKTIDGNEINVYLQADGDFWSEELQIFITPDKVTHFQLLSKQQTI